MQQRPSLCGESTRRKAADRDVILYVRLQGSTNQPAHYTVTVTAVVVVRCSKAQGFTAGSTKISAAFQSDRISLNNCNLESVESVAQSKRTVIWSLWSQWLRAREL